MHNIIKLFLCVFMSLSFLCGCEFSKPSVKINDMQIENDKAVIDLEIPEFLNFENDEFEDRINTEYKEHIDFLVDSFIKELPDKSLETGIFELKQTIHLNSSPIISIVGDIYSFTGGIHGASSRHTKNIDTTKSVELNLADLFTDGEYEKKLNSEIESIVSKNPELYNDLWEKPVILPTNQKCFYLTKKDLVIYYPPYELSYYARGFVEFRVPYQNISGYLKPEYKHLKG